MTQPTEGDARRLLEQAAATIDVDETAPMTLTGLPGPRPRRWPVLATAAAVVLAVGGGYLVAQQLGGQPAPGPVRDVKPEPVEHEHVYTDDQLPSLLAYTTDEASELLSSRGYAVVSRKVHSCDQSPGYVLGTTPGPGTVLAPGDTVRVRVTAGPSPTVDCAQRPDAWQQAIDLARFARGLAPAPDFADDVRIAVGDGAAVSLSREQAADPAMWVLCDGTVCHSPLAALEQVLTRPAEMDGFFAETFPVVTDDLPGSSAVDFVPCLTPVPVDRGPRAHPSTFVYVDYPFDGPRLCPPPPVLQIEWTDDRRIAAVRLSLAAESPPEQVAPTPARRAAADAFVAWARGAGPAPQFADRVRVMYGGGGAFGSPGWTDEPENRGTYAGCSGLGFPSCGLDPVAILANYKGKVVASPGRSICADAGGVPEEFAQEEQDVVRLEEPEPASCAKAWAVELWIDEDGVVYAVNQAGAFMPTDQLGGKT